MRFLSLLLLLPGLVSAADLKIKTMTAQMKYDVDEFIVSPGESVTLSFENGDDLPHNFVLCKPGTDVLALSMKQMEKPEEALKRNWLPDDPSIIAHTGMLNPHQTEKISFTMPEKPGVYPFVCTFPGHAMTMKGKITSQPTGPGLSDLSFKLYLGDWKTLPNFSKLSPHREGSIPDNLIQIKLDDYKNEFGIVYNATLNAPKQGKYRFFISGDDGVRLLIDNKVVILHDGIHPAGDIKEASIELAEGPHKFVLEYFQAAGQAEVFAAWKGVNFQITPLSAWKPKDWKLGAKAKRQADFPPIPLLAKDTPILYRNFIADAGNRAIGVGYPGGINIAWSTESMNLALLWRGAFMDASKHWNSRGGGHQPPLGYDVIRPSGPLSSAPEARWLGYTLDSSGYPSFRYALGNATITDTFRAEGDGTKPEGKLTRTVTVQGEPGPNAKLLLAIAQTVTPVGEKHEFLSGNIPWSVTAPGASLTGNQLHLPLTAGKHQVTYQWVK
jgi:azurin